jgi:hypothetical protein
MKPLGYISDTMLKGMLGGEWDNGTVWRDRPSLYHVPVFTLDQVSEIAGKAYKEGGQNVAYDGAGWYQSAAKLQLDAIKCKESQNNE